MSDPVDPYEDSIAAYVLGALDAADESAVDRHLHSCPGCQELERSLRTVAAMLPLAARETAPPPAMRERILAAAGAQEMPRAHGSGRSHPHRHIRVGARPRAGRVRSAWSRLAVPALAVLSLALAGMTGWDLQQLAEARSAVAQGQIKPASPSMAGTTGETLSLSDQKLIVVSFEGMPPLKPGRVYELWLGGDGKFAPAGVFQPGSDGSKLLVLRRSPSDYSEIALTVEPGPSGTSVPTEAPAMSGSL